MSSLVSQLARPLLLGRQRKPAGQPQARHRCAAAAAASGGGAGGEGAAPQQQQQGKAAKQRQQRVEDPDEYDLNEGAFWEGLLDAEAPAPHEEAQSEEQQAARVRSGYARDHCYGCGVGLQTEDPEVAGYVETERYEVKRKHRQLGQLLCFRCQGLSNGAMIPAVADFAQRPGGPAAAGGASSGGVRAVTAQAAAAAAGAAAQQQATQPAAAAAAQQQQQQQGGAAVAASRGVATRVTGFLDKTLLTPEELREKLKVVQGQRALVVLLVDLLDASGSILGRVRDLVGNNPIMLIGTKVDLLPPGTDPAAVAEWLEAAAAFKRINAVSTHLVSSKSGLGVPAAVAAIRRERRGRDVYVMGAANVGKSAFIRALVRDMASMGSRQYDPLALSRGRFLPVESAMPGTTLELIPMEVFAAGGCLYDTPGLHLHHRVPHLLTPAENKQLHPRRKLRPYVPPSPSELLQATTADCSLPSEGAGPSDQAAAAAAAAAGAATSSAPGPRCNVATYWWGGLAKIQVLGCPADTELAFYGPQALLVEASVEAADDAGGVAGASASPGGFYMGSMSSSDSDSGSEGEDGVVRGGAPRGAAAAAATPHAGVAAVAEEPQGFGAGSVMRRGGLRPTKELTLRCPAEGGRRPIADIAISGMPGWIAVHAGCGSPSVSVRVWTPPGVEVFTRPPLPVPTPLADDAPPPPPPGGGRAAAAGGGRVGDWW